MKKLSKEQLKDLLAYFNLRLGRHCDYPTWLRVGMSIYHVTAGAQDGLEMWVNWREESNAELCRKKWASFSKLPNSELDMFSKDIINKVLNLPG